MDDARSLRQDLSLSSGERLVFKYSSRTPEAPKTDHNRQSAKGLRLSKKKAHLRTSSQDSRSDSPRRSPARFLQEQGGIEGILSEAAKGVYSRGEKWGVNKAFRDAVSGLQSGTSSPRKVFEGSRWSLDEGKSVADDAKRLAARVKALEERNRALGKMLNTAMEDLWNQQKQFEQKKLEMETNALNVAIAKVQFVQVYLEDSTIPLLSNRDPEEAESEVRRDTEPQPAADGNGKIERSLSPPSKTQEQITASSKSPGKQPDPPTIVEPDQVLAPSPVKSSLQSAEPSTPESPPSETSQPPKPAIHPTKSTSRPPSAIVNHAANLGPSPFSHSRPSLAQSSFSWMLKDSSDDVDAPGPDSPNRPKSSFVSASPFPPANRPEDAKKRRPTAASARAKAGFLFGDEKSDGPLGEGKRGEGRKGEEVVLGEDGEEGEGFGMGTLRGIRRVTKDEEEV